MVYHTSPRQQRHFSDRPHNIKTIYNDAHRYAHVVQLVQRIQSDEECAAILVLLRSIVPYNSYTISALRESAVILPG